VRKILSSQQIREVDALTIRNRNIEPHELMAQAAKAFVKTFCKLYNETRPILIFCGPGNNGGDGLAIARLLLKKNYEVTVYYLPANEYSADFRYNLEKLIKVKSGCVKLIKESKQLPAVVKKSAILVDALFGTGLNKPIEGWQGQVIEWINSQPNKCVSVDIPSGLTDTLPFPGSAIVQSDMVITFQIPKQALLLEDNKQYVNEFIIADIGLDAKAIAGMECTTFLTEESDVRQKIHHVKRFDTKWGNGHALLVAGSYEKTGAALLAASACMRSGTGLLTVHTPKTAKDIFNITLPEAMIQPDADENNITAISFDGRYNAAGIGPGIGTNESTHNAFKKFLLACTIPLVIDADALNLLSSDKELLDHLPEQCILTPHEKEFDRLTQKHVTLFHRMATQRSFSVKHKCVVVLKSAYTTVSDTNGNIFFNSTGNGGMAKAGAGDVLTGITTAFLAKGYNTLDAAICAVYIHGLAGDEAAKKPGKISMKSGDIIEYLPKAFKKLS
jgi:hydroxyethylthiazole kinase-like uncharacterized protein yjeF